MPDRPHYLAGLPRKVAAAGVLLTDPAGRLLLVDPTYKPGWEIPGGVVEARESARSAAAREVREELGLDLAIGRLLVVEHQTAPSDKGDALMFVYDGGAIADPAAIRLPPPELAAYRFVAADALDDVLSPGRVRRLRAALAARGHGTLVELEDDR